MARMPIPRRLAAITPRPCGRGALRGSNPPLGGLPPGTGQVAYALLTHPPLSRGRSPDPVRLACVKPAASVHPEPGSNSSLYSLFLAPYYIDAILPIYNKKVLLLVLGTCCTYLSSIFNEQSVEKETILISNGVQR